MSLELAWAAGFFDGEGCTSTHLVKANHRNPEYMGLVMRVGQTDREPLERFQAAVGCGNIGGPYYRRNRPSAQPYYQWSVSGERVEAVLDLLWEWLSTPKRLQAQKVRQALIEWRAAHPPKGLLAYQRGTMTRCHRGHVKTQQKNGRWACRRCGADAQRRRREGAAK